MVSQGSFPQSLSLDVTSCQWKPRRLKSNLAIKGWCRSYWKIGMPLTMRVSSHKHIHTHTRTYARAHTQNYSHSTIKTISSQVPWRIIQSLNSRFEILCACALLHTAKTRTYTHAYTHARTYTHAHTHIHTRMNTTYTHTYTHINTHTHTHTLRERERERESSIDYHMLTR